MLRVFNKFELKSSCMRFVSVANVWSGTVIKLFLFRYKFCRLESGLNEFESTYEMMFCDTSRVISEDRVAKVSCCMVVRLLMARYNCCRLK